MITYESKGGHLTVTEASGSGSFHSSGDGNIDITFTTVSSDLSAYAKNGNITVTLPESMSFIFSAKQKKDIFKRPFQTLYRLLAIQQVEQLVIMLILKSGWKQIREILKRVLNKRRINTFVT